MHVCACVCRSGRTCTHQERIKAKISSMDIRSTHDDFGNVRWMCLYVCVCMRVCVYVLAVRRCAMFCCVVVAVCCCVFMCVFVCVLMCLCVCSAQRNFYLSLFAVVLLILVYFLRQVVKKVGTTRQITLMHAPRRPSYARRLMNGVMWRITCA